MTPVDMLRPDAVTVPAEAGMETESSSPGTGRRFGSGALLVQWVRSAQSPGPPTHVKL